MSEAQERADRVIRSWSVLYEARKTVLRRWPRVCSIPLRSKHTRVLLDEFGNGDRVLEIGSSHRKLERPLTAAFKGLVYKSMDIDRETRHDFYSLEEISERFNAVILFEVIEHLPFAEGVTLLAKAFDLLEPAGRLILSTPNLAHPTQFYRDPTHVTPWSHEGIGGALLALGFELERFYRIYNAPFVHKILHKYLARPAYRFLGVDFAPGLMVIARKPGTDTGFRPS